jgi:hypothetical protein
MSEGMVKPAIGKMALGEKLMYSKKKSDRKKG